MHQSVNTTIRRVFRGTTAPAHICFGFAALLCWASGVQAQPVGSVKTYAGEVNLERESRAVNVVTGLAANKGDRFTTGANGRLAIQLNDQSTLDLYESSTLTLDDQAVKSSGSSQTRISLLSGIVRAVVHSAGGPADFEVHTPNAVAAVRGTDFDTGYHQNVHRANFKDCDRFTDVFTREGMVEVYNLANPAATVTLKPHQGTTVPCAGAPLPGIQASGIGTMAAFGTGALSVIGGATAGGILGSGGSGVASPSK